MDETTTVSAAGKFRDPARTADGQPRARVAMTDLETLWINTGTLCNLECRNCYIESSPKNDRLAYFRFADLVGYLDEIERDRLPTRLIGFTGGEPFMNPEIREMLEEPLARGFEALVLTNAMRPMMRHKEWLAALNAAHGARLSVRVSVDHYTEEEHEAERGPRSWAPMIEGLRFLSSNGFRLSVAGRLFTGETEDTMRGGYRDLFAREAIEVDARDPNALVLFPEMDETADVPEITESCWGILGVTPQSVMCADARMAVRRKGSKGPAVVACTLLPYDDQFELGASLAEASRPVSLNHPHCARFCVLGGASCGSAG